MSLLIHFYKRKYETITEETEDINAVRDQIYNREFSNKNKRPKNGYIEDEVDVCKLESIGMFDRKNILWVGFHYSNKCYDYGCYKEDGCYVEVEKWEIEDFIRKAKITLDEREKINENFAYLPITKGLFFGNDEYNDQYFEEVKECMEEFEKILAETDFDRYQVIMFASW